MKCTFPLKWKIVPELKKKSIDYFKKNQKHWNSVLYFPPFLLSNIAPIRSNQCVGYSFSFVNIYL